MKIGAEFWLRAAFTAALAAAGCLGVASYRHLERERSDLAAIAGAEALSNDLNALLLASALRQSAMRRYALAPDPAQLQQCDRFEHQVAALARRIRQKTERREDWRAGLDRLDAAASAAAEWQRGIIAAVESGGAAAAHERFATGRGEELQHALREAVTRLQIAEEKQRQERWRSLELNETQLHGVSFLLLGIVLALLTASYVLVRHLFAVRQQVEHGLARRVASSLLELAAVGARLEQVSGSERRLAIEQRTAEARFRALVDQATDALFVHDEAGRILDVNRTACTDLGYTRTELLRMNVWELAAAREAVAARSVWTAVPPGSSITLVREHRRKDGSAFPVELRVGCHLLGEQKAYLALARDITDRRKAELALAQAAAIVQSSPDAIVSVGLDWNFVSWNPAAERLFGYTAAEAIGRPITIVYGPAQLSQRQEAQAKLAQGALFGPVDAVRRHKDGHAVHVSLTVSAVRDPSGRMIGACAILRDIKERLRLEAEVLRIRDHEQQRLGRDLHDGVGQQLTAIELMVHELLASAPRGRTFAAKAEHIGTLLRSAIHDVRALSHGLSPSITGFAGLRAALDGLITAAGPGRSRLICAETGPPLPNGAAMQLYRIAQEAFNNAVRHSNAARIEIRLAHAGSQLRLEIADNGTGRPDTEPFVSGVGLQSMRYRADLIGASFSVQPTPGGGVTVVCSVPISP